MLKSRKVEQQSRRNYKKKKSKKKVEQFKSKKIEKLKLKIQTCRKVTWQYFWLLLFTLHNGSK